MPHIVAQLFDLTGKTIFKCVIKVTAFSRNCSITSERHVRSQDCHLTLYFLSNMKYEEDKFSAVKGKQIYMFVD